MGTGPSSGTVVKSTVAAVPGAPTSLAAANATASSVILTWTAPAGDGGSPITDHIVQYRKASAEVWNTHNRTASPRTAASETVAGLSAGTQYGFRVAAVNGAGTGPYTVEATGRTPAANHAGASPPTDILSLLYGNGTIQLLNAGDLRSGTVALSIGISANSTRLTVADAAGERTFTFAPPGPLDADLTLKADVVGGGNSTSAPPGG